MILCFALGIANIFTIHPLIIIFSIICLLVAHSGFQVLPSPILAHSSSANRTYLPPGSAPS